jgi:hypothetical protein
MVRFILGHRVPHGTKFSRELLALTQNAIDVTNALFQFQELIE